MDYKLEVDPAKREWEYDDTGEKIYKVEAGYGCKTPWPQPEKKWNGVWKEEPYYVDLP